jgi:hypothetical protein
VPDPQQQTTPTSAPASDGGIDLSGLRVRTLGGIDLSGLRTRTLQQAQSELPQLKITPPWEEEPTLPSAPTSKLGKAYEDGKRLLQEHGQHFSEKVLRPFRDGLDRIADELEEAGESGHTSQGGQLVGPARALLSGAGTLLRQVPVGRNLKETALAWATPPEFPEGRTLSRELKAGEKAEQWRTHDLGKQHDIPSEAGYAYHATNAERAKEIAESGGMRTHKPWEHTDQSAWPDGSTEKRIYFTPQASSAWQFAPEEGKSVLLRVKQDAAKLKAEGTGDLYTQKPIHHKNVEILGDDKQWHSLSELNEKQPGQKSPFRIAAETPDKISDFHSAVQNTEGAELSDSGLTLDVVRHQKPEQAGERAVRTGVFFLPEKKSPYQRYYTTGRQGYGGTQRIEGRTTFENPIIAKGASGGKVPERAYDAINGEGAYDEMRQDVLDSTTHGWNRKSDDELTQNVANVLEQYGGNPDLAEDIVRNSKEGNTLAYAVQEHIVASSVRKAGHDGIVGFSKIKGQPRLSEVFDLRHDKYPISSQLFESKTATPDLSGLRTRAATPAPQSEPEDKAERRAGVGGYSGDSPTESQFVQKVIQGAKDTETWAPADMGDGGKAWLDKDGKYIPQDKEHQDIAENFWNRRIRIGNLEGKGPLLVHAEGAPNEAQRKAIAADIKKQGGAIYDLKKDGNNVTGEAKTVGDFLRAIDNTWKPESAAKIDLSGLRVRPVKAGRQAAGMDTFIASDGRKYQFPSSDDTWGKILKVDPGAKRLK